MGLIAGPGRLRHHSAALQLGPDYRHVAVVRRFVADRCRHWGCRDLAEDAELVATELVTNALLHAGPDWEFRARLTDAALRLQVTDGGPGMPAPRAAGAGDEHGRGLTLVGALCAAWGVERLPAGGKVVWAELPRAGVRERACSRDRGP